MFRSSSKLPWLSGNTRRHFPVREATKDKQLDSQIPHIPSISTRYTQYARYVQIQHGITTWLYDSSNLFIRLRGARYYKHGSHDPTIVAYKSSTCGSLTCLGTDIYKWKRLRSLIIYHILPRAQDRSWGNKLNVEVHAELLVRLKSPWVQMYPARRTLELATYALVSTKGMVEFNCSKPALTRWLSWTTSASNSFGVAHTSPHIHQSIHHYGSAPVSLQERHP